VELFVKKSRLTGEIRKLRDDVQRRPNPASFSQLAHIYRELGSLDEALAIATQCAERFPLNETAYLTQGEIRLERFRRDLVAKDAVVAEGALRQVLRLNAGHVGAHMCLAELLHLVGMPAECVRHLRQAAVITPSARDLQALLAELDSATPEACTEPFEEMAGRVQAKGAFAGDPAKFARTSASPKSSAPPASEAALDDESLRAAMAVLGANEGLRNAVLLSREGAIVADHCAAESLPRARFGEIVAEIRDAADDASRRMDTGALVRADLEGDAGSFVVARVRGLTIGLHYAAPLRADRAWELVEDFAARQLAAGREEARA
jgi:predicted regulator of Ras-like GTPase activity (Roadblock/LC7/MglB family)